jgi:hypothetical protein
MTTGADDHDRLELVSTIRRNTQAWVSAATPELRLRGEIPFEGIEAGLHVLCNRGWNVGNTSSHRDVRVCRLAPSGVGAPTARRHVVKGWSRAMGVVNAWRPSCAAAGPMRLPEVGSGSCRGGVVRTVRS